MSYVYPVSKLLEDRSPCNIIALGVGGDSPFGNQLCLGLTSPYLLANKLVHSYYMDGVRGYAVHGFANSMGTSMLTSVLLSQSPLGVTQCGSDECGGLTSPLRSTEPGEPTICMANKKQDRPWPKTEILPHPSQLLSENTPREMAKTEQSGLCVLGIHSVLVFWGRRNKVPPTGGLKTTEIDCSTLPEAGCPKPSHHQNHGPYEICKVKSFLGSS